MRAAYAIFSIDMPAKKKPIPGHDLTHSYVFWFVPLAAVFVLTAVIALVPVFAVAAATFALLWTFMIPAIVCAAIGAPLMIAHYVKQRDSLGAATSNPRKRFGLGAIILSIFIIVLVLWAVQAFAARGSSGDDGPVAHPQPGGGYCVGDC
jgi:hypothetical protein